MKKDKEKINKVKNSQKRFFGFFLQPATSNLKPNGGFTLIETLVSLSIFAVSITALIVLTGAGIFNTNYAKNKLTAGFLAQEGIELVRHMRDTAVLSDPVSGWDTGFKALVPPDCVRSTGTGYCTLDPQILGSISGLSVCNFDNTSIFDGCSLSYDPSIGYIAGSAIGQTPFRRLIFFDDISPDYWKVTSTIVWRQGSASYSVSTSEILFNWNP